MQIIDRIEQAAATGEKWLTVLIDPDKFEEEDTAVFLEKLPSGVSFLLVGGSTVDPCKTDKTVAAMKAHSALPVILFPGDVSQVSLLADGILFLSLLSGRNPEYLIEQQIKAAPLLHKSSLEVIPTGYILLDGGNKSSVEKISRTRPIPQDNIDLIINTALAGEFSGKKLIYLEAGSGARSTVLPQVISEVKKAISIPLVVGGGICSRRQLDAIYEAGADIAVLGTVLEKGHLVETVF